jgi:hypothetical protein
MSIHRRLPFPDSGCQLELDIWQEEAAAGLDVSLSFLDIILLQIHFLTHFSLLMLHFHQNYHFIVTFFTSENTT